MENLLQKLQDNNMCVHVIDHDEGYADFNCPIAWIVDSTHYVMRGSKIIYVGTIKNVERFILML